jgi:CCR4-NOT transcription complex subunit 10
MNEAILLFHTKQPLAALKIMTAVMQYYENMTNAILEKAGLFTIHLLLETNQPKRAAALLEMVKLRLGISEIAADETDSSEPIVESTDCDVQELKKMWRFVTIRCSLFNGKVLLLPSEETSDFSVLKGHQYYLGNDYQMAAKELSKHFKNKPITILANGEDQNTCLTNNMGVIHFSVKHYALATRFFQQALLFDIKAYDANKSGNAPFHCMGATKRPEILYNLGIALLYLERPQEAFECLLKTQYSFHNNPRLWLRLAECCIMVHKQGLKEKENKFITSAVIGSGKHRKYVLTPTPPKYVSDEGQSFAIPSPNMEFSSLCLRNALVLVNDYVQNMKTQVPIDKSTPWHKIPEGMSCSPSKSLKMVSLVKLKCAILSAYSYTLLYLGDYVMSLKYARELLTIEGLPEAYLMLGHLYCAESLIMLDRPTEALSFLEPKFIKDLKSEDFETRSSPNWNVNSCEAAQAILTYNLAVSLIIHGDLEAGKTVMTACNHTIVFPYLKKLKMFTELAAGNIENCRIMIKIDTPQYL